MAINAGNRNRQKMINLMYIIFIAMMALSVSKEVVDGFTLVDDGLRRTIATSQERNDQLANDLATAYRVNPDKATVWYHRSQELRQATDSLVDFIHTLKLQIAQRTDGTDADPTHIESKDHIGAASEVMLNPLAPQGSVLRKRIEAFRRLGRALHPSAEAADLLLTSLSTDTPEGASSWEEAYFDNMPTIAAITLLSKLENDLRYAEGQILQALLQGIDSRDVRVNRLTAQVIPDSRIVMRGSPYRASIVLASIDTTQRPRIVVNGNELPDSTGLVSLPTRLAGTFPLSGFIETRSPRGEVERRAFDTSYTVIEPIATVAPTMMNVLYAGIDNPLRIAVPGVAPSDVQATATGASLTRRGDLWIARPTAGTKEVIVSVSARIPSGEISAVGQANLRVRSLPDPMPYIDASSERGGSPRFRGGRISKQALLHAGQLRAAIDDNILDVAYTVRRFQLISFDAMGNAIPEVSSGASFSERQLQQIRQASRGKRLYITDVLATGPDGIERRIPSIELIIH